MEDQVQVSAIRDKFRDAIVESCLDAYRCRQRGRTPDGDCSEPQVTLIVTNDEDDPVEHSSHEWVKGMGMFRRTWSRRAVDLTNLFPGGVSKAALVTLCRLCKVGHINDLVLRGVSLNKPAMEILAEALQSKELKSLDLSKAKLDESCAAAVVQLLHHCPSLSSLDLSDNPLGDAGLRALTAGIMDPPRQEGGGVQELGSGSRRRSRSMQTSPRAPAASTGVSLLHRCASFVHRSLEYQISSTLEELHLRSVGLGDEGLLLLASVLPQLNLVLLDVAGNPFTDRGLTALSDVLFGMRGLRVLNLSRLPRVENWHHLLSRLMCSSVQRLSLCGNALDAPAFHWLCSHVVKRMLRLAYLNVSGCPIASTRYGCRWLMDTVRDALQVGRDLTICSHADFPITEGWSSVHKACLLGDEQRALGQTLVPQGFPLLERDAYGRSLLHLLCETGNLKCYDAVLRYAQTYMAEEWAVNVLLNQEDVHHESALTVACLRGHVLLVNALLDAGAHVTRMCFESVLQIDNEYNECLSHQKCIPASSSALQPNEGSGSFQRLQSPMSTLRSKPEHTRLCRKGKRVLETVIDRLTPHCAKYLRASAFRRFVNTFFFYIIFLISFTSLAGYHCTGFQNTKFTVLQVVNDQLTGELLDDGKVKILRMEDVRKVNEFWTWMHGSFIPAMFPTPEVQTNQLVLLDYNDVVGAVRLRQLRVRNGTCMDSVRAGISPVRGKNMSCYGAYSETKEDTSPLGPGAEPYKQWRSTDEIGGHPYYSEKFGVTYGGGGYVVDLTQNITQMKKFLKHLQQQRWIDDPTRMVAVEFTLFNPFVGQYIAARLMFEIPPSGGVFPSEHFVTFRLQRYTKQVGQEVHWDHIPLFLEVFVFLCFIRLAFEEVHDASVWWREFQRERDQPKATSHEDESPLSGVLCFLSRLGRHFLSEWNGVDVIVLGLAVSIYVVRGLIMVESYQLWRPTLLMNEGAFVDFHWMAQLHTWEQDLIAFSMVFCWLKILKYIVILPSVGPAVQAIISTITAHYVVSFMLLFVIVSLSFSVALHFALGYDSMQYNTLGSSGMSYFRMLFGDFDFHDFRSSDNWGGLWFIMSLLSGSMLLVNIFVAVVGQVYEAQLGASTLTWQSKAVREYQKQIWLQSSSKRHKRSMFSWLWKLLAYHPLSGTHSFHVEKSAGDQERCMDAGWVHYLIQEDVLSVYMTTPREHLESRSSVTSFRQTSLLLDSSIPEAQTVAPEVQRLHREMADLTQELMDLRIEKARLQHQVSTLQEEKEEAQADRKGFEDEGNVLRKQTAVLRKERDILRVELQSVKEELVRRDHSLVADALKAQEAKFQTLLDHQQLLLQVARREHHNCNRSWRAHWDAVQDALGTLLPHLSPDVDRTGLESDAGGGSHEPLTPHSMEHQPCPHHAAIQDQSLGLTQGMVEAVAEQLRSMATAETTRDSSAPSEMSSIQVCEQLEELRTQHTAATSTVEGLQQRNEQLTTQVQALQRELDEKKHVLGQLMAQVEVDHGRSTQGPRFALTLKQKAAKLKASFQQGP
eukprot:GGOE01002054.1.p1 GENE.GGOE01002054.1~~GGOE01002054.1.p1  ORF type:complete len:1534 (+),score=465.72 GGOE01002054.1:50-4651(+)